MPDPYQTLGVSPSVSDAELRTAYRRLVRRHHPDHNGGSVESARRFEAVQEAYTAALAMRRSHVAGAAAAATSSASGRAGPAGSGTAGRGPGTDAHIDARLADLERELREAQAERERARRLAQEAARAADAERAAAVARGETERRYTDEELGYISTDDSFSKIFADAASELSDRLSESRDEHQVPKSVSDRVPKSVTDRVPKSVADLIDDLGAKLTGERPKRKQ